MRYNITESCYDSTERNEWEEKYPIRFTKKQVYGVFLKTRDHLVDKEIVRRIKGC
jgi:hypothetical protein